MTATRTTKTQDDLMSIMPSMSRPRALGILFCITAACHLSLGIVVAVVTFEYPLTVFETKTKASVDAAFACVYDYGRTSDGGFFCSTDDAVPNGDRSMPTPECLLPLATFGASLGATPGKGPWIQAYELTELITESDGTRLARVLLLIVQFVTGISDLVKGVFLLLAPLSKIEACAATGTWTWQWREYAITTAALALFVASLAQVHELSALILSSAASFALQHVGLLVEVFAAEGRQTLALMLFFLPGLVLHAALWFPVFRSVYILRHVLCASGTGYFCEPTCFENDYRFHVFTLVGFSVYSSFALVPLYALYRYDERWGVVTVRNRALRAIADAFLFLFAYVPVATCTAVVSFLSPDILSARKVPSAETVRRSFVRSQWAYALLSLSSKTFISGIFIALYSTNYPWPEVRRLIE